MSDRRPDLFPELSPPRGGLEQLRNRLDDEAVHRPTWRWLAAPAAAAALLVGIWLGAPQPARAWDTSLNPALVRYGAAAPGEGVRVPMRQRHQSAVTRGAGSDEVIFYWVATTRTAAEVPAKEQAAP